MKFIQNVEHIVREHVDLQHLVHVHLKIVILGASVRLAMFVKFMVENAFLAKNALNFNHQK
jgi:hypothetical protein